MSIMLILFLRHFLSMAGWVMDIRTWFCAVYKRFCAQKRRNCNNLYC